MSFACSMKFLRRKEPKKKICFCACLEIKNSIELARVSHIGNTDLVRFCVRVFVLFKFSVSPKMDLTPGWATYGKAPPGGLNPYPVIYLFLPKWYPFHIPRTKLHPFVIPQG